MWAAKISFWTGLITNAKSVLFNPVVFYDNNILINRCGVDKFIIGIVSVYIIIVLVISRFYTILEYGSLFLTKQGGFWAFWGWFSSFPVIGDVGLFVVTFSILHMVSGFYACFIFSCMLFDERLIFRDVIAFVMAQIIILIPLLTILIGLLVSLLSLGDIRIVSASWGSANLLTVVMFLLIYAINVLSIGAIARRRFGFKRFAAYSPFLGIILFLVSIQVWLSVSGNFI